jgi:hypothetical protein
MGDVQVLTTTASAGWSSATGSKPRARKASVSRSESAWLSLQPSVMIATVGAASGRGMARSVGALDIGVLLPR